MIAPVRRAPRYCQVNQLFSLVVLSKDFHAGMGLETELPSLVQFLPLCTGFSLRRDSTEQELVRQVGTPSLGSSHWVNTR